MNAKQTMQAKAEATAAAVKDVFGLTITGIEVVCDDDACFANLHVEGIDPADGYFITGRNGLGIVKLTPNRKLDHVAQALFAKGFALKDWDGWFNLIDEAVAA